MHLLHRGLGGEAAAHRLGHAQDPAAVGGEHAVALEHVAVLAMLGHVARREEVVDRALHRGNGAAQALQLLLRILGDDLTDDDPRLVQHGRADGEPAIDARAFQPRRQRARAVGGLEFERVHKPAARHHLGDDHGDGLQRLDLVLGVIAQRAVLHHQHAEHVPAAQDRHAHQRVIDFLAGLRPVGEVGMRLRIRERQWPRGRRDDTDQPFADAQPRAMHRLGTQPLGGEEFQHLAGAHEVASSTPRPPSRRR